MDLSKASTKFEDRRKFLSENVYKLICDVGLSKDKEGTPIQLLLNRDHVLMKEYLCAVLDSQEDCDRISFLKSVSSLATTFHSVDHYMSNLTTVDFNSTYGNYFAWTSSQQVFLRCFHLLKSDDPVMHDLAMLLCTSFLERTLGDVYLLKGKQCPALLKDLLVTKELRDIFGNTLMKSLRIMIGPPSSLNLRNIFWHGFAAPGQIKKQYLNFLLLLIATLGWKLRLQKIFDVHHRGFVNLPAIYFDSDSAKIRNLEIIEYLIKETKFIPNIMRPVWISASRAYFDNRKSDAIVLLLTQLENCLRCVFARLNNCEDRIATAESAVFYTTFAEILDKNLPDGGKNKLISTLGIPFLDLLDDLLVYPDGLRLRDQISHGEINLDDINDTIAQFVYAICLAMCYNWLPQSSSSRDQASLRQIYEWAVTYETQYHPVAIAKNQVSVVSKKISSWLDLPRPCKEDLPFVIDWRATPIDTALLSLCERASNIERDISNQTEDDVFRAFGKFEIPVAEIFIPRHNHSKLSPELAATDDCAISTSSGDGASSVINHSNLILRQSTRICDNVQAALHLRYEQFSKRELRSRQRKTYARMLDSIPFISVGLKLCILYTFKIIKDVTSFSSTRHDVNLRIAKNILKYCDNIASFTALDKNRWEESVSLTQSILEFLSPQDNCNS